MESGEFKAIWLPLAGRFYRVALYILESRADAEDAVQELFIRIWNTRDKLGDVRNPAAYGITIIRNICLDKIRSASSSRTVKAEEETMDSLPDPDDSVENSLIRKENLEKIRACMARLPDMQRKVLEMRVFENMPYSEIALRTGLSEVNVRVKLSSARKSLKKMTSDEENR